MNLDFDQMAKEEIFEAIKNSVNAAGISLSIVNKDGSITRMHDYKDSAAAFALMGTMNLAVRLIEKEQTDHFENEEE